ncbi:MAG: molybdenum ABC transporter ATP-binding protein [Deferribacteraceae bacterium]|jgi:molybdate transport system ATP-binding protein|nr:molybdenum ABC transporter ATP-binding protein [Deferribacteraceae bacterium]
MISISVVKKFKDIAVSAEFEAGDGCTVLFGTSGAGKSTVINMIAGLATPDSGRIVVDGAILFDSREGINLPPNKRRAGYVFQDSRLFPHLTVLKNLTYGYKKSESRLNVSDIADFLGITRLLDRYPKNLSGGEKQRVALGRALLCSPKILLMDEPLASLDSGRRNELVEYISSLKEFSIPIIYVSHTLDEIMRLSDYLGIMENGKLIRTGTALDVINSTDFLDRLSAKEFGSVCCGKVMESGENEAAVDFCGHRMELAGTVLTHGQTVRFRTPAIDVLLSLEKASTSARNNFAGSVSEIRIKEQIADVLVDIGGASIWARVTKRSLAEMGLEEGRKVFIMVKSVAAAQYVWFFKEPPLKKGV